MFFFNQYPHAPTLFADNAKFKVHGTGGDMSTVQPIYLHGVLIKNQ